ncbi:hypothetical protein D3C86_2028200 [compost metagenome]
MLFNALDPFWIHNPRAENAQGFFFQIPHHRPGGVLRISEIMLRLLACEVADRGNHATMKLQVIVAVEQVVLPVILVVQCHFYAGQPLRKFLAGVHTLRVA